MPRLQRKRTRKTRRARKTKRTKRTRAASWWKAAPTKMDVSYGLRKMDG
jgi:hypothetical protein